MTFSSLVAGVLVFTILVDSFLALLLFCRSRGGIQTTILILHLVGILGWAMSILYILKMEYIFAAQMAYVFGLFIAVTVYYFVKFFPLPVQPVSWWVYWPLPVVSLVSIGVFIPELYFVDYEVIASSYIHSTAGAYANLYVVTLTYFLIHPLITLLVRLYNHSYSLQIQRQSKTLLYGIGTFFFVGLLTNSILPVIFGWHYFNGIGPVFSLVLAIFIIHNIYRYKFLEIQSLIQRGVIYILLFSLVVACYLSLVTLLSILLQTITTVTVITAGALTTAIGIFTIPIIDEYLRRWTHPFFFKGQFDYSVTLYELSDKLNKTLSLNNIVDITTSSLATIFGASLVHINLGDNPGTISEDMLCLSLITSTGKVGELQLGDKKSGDVYSRKDKQLLLTIVNQVSIAIERSQLYEEVKDYSYELEQKVAQRTRELEALHLYQKQMLDEISHGLQTPITVINNTMETLAVDVKHQPYLHSFKNSVHSLENFVRNLLRLSQLEVPGDTWQQTIFDLGNLCKEVIDYSEISLGTIEIVFRSNIEPNIFAIGNNKKIEEVLNILILNAVKYRDPKKMQLISLTLTQSSDSIVLKVSDTGLGIDAIFLPHIFKRFYRVRDADHMHTEGSGLGLAIAEAIIKKHQGTIRVTSEKGKYTEFTITLPLPQWKENVM